MKKLKEVKLHELNTSTNNRPRLLIEKLRLFTAVDEVELTDELISEIVKEKKWKFEDLKQFQKDGATWNTRRKSIMLNDYGSSFDDIDLETLSNIPTRTMKKKKKADDRPYWHQISQEEIDKLIADKKTIGDVMKTYQQPNWCDYEEALAYYSGCWSLCDTRKDGNRTKISTDFCKDCDCFNNKKNQ